MHTEIDYLHDRLMYILDNLCYLVLVKDKHFGSYLCFCHEEKCEMGTEISSVYCSGIQPFFFAYPQI
jgi:hypothetical protein